MRISSVVFSLTILCLSGGLCVAQSPAAAPAASSAPTAPAAPSGMLQPSLDVAQQTLSAIKLEKWKKGSVRDEAEANIAALLRDLQTNVPPLLTAADETPGALSKVLPLSRHIDALYDVLLRVVEAARVSAPPEQITALQQALTGLGTARLALSDHMQETAAAQERQLNNLQSALQAQAASLHSAASATPVCSAPTPVRKAKRKPKPPATTAPAKSTTPATATPTPGK